MHRRTLAPLLALAVAACGDAFTAGVDDGGSQLPPNDGSTLDAAVTDATADGAGGDATQPGDGSVMNDAFAGDSTSPPPSDGGISVDGPACLRTCPSGFDCIMGKCEDIAGLHFGAKANPAIASNWLYGSSSGPGLKPSPYMEEWNASGSSAGSLDVWSNNKGDIELSVFHNPGLAAVDYAGMTVPPVTSFTLGVYPSASNSQYSAVRWSAPQAGLYDISVQFTGISTPPSKVGVGISFNGTVSGAINGMPTGGILNFGATPSNAFTFSAPGQTLSSGDTLDFYVSSFMNGDDSPGGVSLAVLIVAE